MERLRVRHRVPVRAKRQHGLGIPDGRPEPELLELLRERPIKSNNRKLGMCWNRVPAIGFDSYHRKLNRRQRKLRVQIECLLRWIRRHGQSSIHSAEQPIWNILV